VVAEKIFDGIVAGTGFFQHGHTYMGHPTACAAALAVQQTIEDEQLLGRVRQMGEGLGERLVDRFGEHPNVGDLRGRGLFRGLELVADRTSKAPFAPEARLNARIKRAAMAEGLMCYPMGGTIDGRTGDHVLLAPPFIVTDDDLDEIVRRLGIAIDLALAGLDDSAT